MLDDKLSNRMAESVEHMAEILKEQARKQRRINDRVGEIETKLFGRSREEKPKKPRLGTATMVSILRTNTQKKNSFIRANKSPMRRNSPSVKDNYR